MSRAERRRRRIVRALEIARHQLAATRPEDYQADRYYRAVRTARERKVRRLESALGGLEEAT